MFNISLLQYWKHLFNSFKGGPDWTLEYPLAMAAIERWRLAILEEHKQWTLRVKKLREDYNNAHNLSNKSLDSYFKTKSGRYLLESFTSLVHVLINL